MGDVAAALRMLDTFASCGADSFVVTKTELEWPGHKKVKWGKTYPAGELRPLLPAMVRTAARPERINTPDGQTVMAGENLIIRPGGQGVAFVQLDDLNSERLDRLRPASFIIHATSPGNYQAWIAVSGATEGKEQFKELMRRVRKAVGGNDKSASHATRIAGTENFKLKYAPAFPTVTIVETHPGRVMTVEQLEALGLLAAPEPQNTVNLKFPHRRESGSAGEWPNYETILARAPLRQDGSGPDRSIADFFWCKRSLQQGWSTEETEAKLVEVSERARERLRGGDPGYIAVTVRNASAATERGRNRA